MKRELRDFPPAARGRGVHLAPSLLSADFANLRGALSQVRKAGCRWLHLDVMDGHFVPNLTFGPLVVSAIRPLSEDLYFDCHLMIEHPEQYIDAFIDAGAQCVTFHVEAAGDQTGKLLKKIRSRKVHAGVSIRPKTPVGEIEEYLAVADLILVMTVEPGFGGQKLIPSTLNKVRQLVHYREEESLNYLIQVDGGINLETAGLAVAAGSDVIVAGSAVFKGGKIRENIRDLKKNLQPPR